MADIDRTVEELQFIADVTRLLLLAEHRMDVWLSNPEHFRGMLFIYPPIIARVRAVVDNRATHTEREALDNEESSP